MSLLNQIIEAEVINDDVKLVDMLNNAVLEEITKYQLEENDSEEVIFDKFDKVMAGIINAFNESELDYKMKIPLFIQITRDLTNTALMLTNFNEKIFVILEDNGFKRIMEDIENGENPFKKAIIV